MEKSPKRQCLLETPKKYITSENTLRPLFPACSPTHSGSETESDHDEEMIKYYLNNEMDQKIPDPPETVFGKYVQVWRSHGGTFHTKIDSFAQQHYNGNARSYGKKRKFALSSSSISLDENANAAKTEHTTSPTVCASSLKKAKGKSPAAMQDCRANQEENEDGKIFGLLRDIPIKNDSENPDIMYLCKLGNE